MFYHVHLCSFSSVVGNTLAHLGSDLDIDMLWRNADGVKGFRWLKGGVVWMFVEVWRGEVGRMGE